MADGFISKQALVQMIQHYIHYYNTRRVQRNLGILTPRSMHFPSLLNKNPEIQANVLYESPVSTVRLLCHTVIKFYIFFCPLDGERFKNQALCVFLFIDESLNAHEFFHAI